MSDIYNDLTNPFNVNSEPSAPQDDTSLINPFDVNTSDSYTASDASLINPFDVNTEQSESPAVSPLERARRGKERALANLSNNESLSDSYTDMGNGWLESNKNKLWNDMSGKEIQSLLSHAVNKHQLQKDEYGNNVDSEGNVYLGKTRRLYDFNTKVGTRDTVKMGLARGDAESSRDRYTGDFLPGELGVDINRLNKDILLPNDVAVMLEAAIHGRREALEHRTVKDIYSDPEAAALYGSGVSEYYNSREGLLGKEVEVDDGLGGKLFDEYMRRLPSEYRRPSNRPENYTNNRIGNTFAGFGATFASELLVNPLDAVGDLTGLYDLGTEAEKTKYVNEFFGYDARIAQDAMERVGAQWDVVADENATVGARMRAAGNGILEAMTTPELLGTSLGAVMAWVTPGGLLGKVGAGSKYLSDAAKIDALVKSGMATKQAGRLAKAKRFMSVDGAKAFLTKQSGFITSSMGNINNQYEEFVQNNNGVELEGEDKARWFAQRFIVQMFNQNLDKIVDFNIIKNPGMLKGLQPVFKAMTNKEFGAAVKGMSKGLAVTTANMGAEAGQEYAQTMMELFNSRYGSEQFKDVKGFMEFLTEEDNVREAGIAALAGAGGAVQFEALGSVGKPALALAGMAKGKFSEVPSEQPVAGNQQAAEFVDQVRKEQAAKAVRTSQVNPEASYYAAQASDDTEVRAKAGEFAATSKAAFMDGTHSVFNSDKTGAEYLAQIGPIIEMLKSEFPDMSTEEIKARAKAGMEAINGKMSSQDNEKFDNTVNQAARRGELFAQLKTKKDVELEAAHGARGFNTYYAAARAALAEGDTKLYKAHLDNLEHFYHYEETKVGRLNEAVEEMTGFVNAEAEQLITTGKASDKPQALNMLISKYRKSDKFDKKYYNNADVDNGYRTFIRHSDVANKILNPAYNRGIFDLLPTAESEVAAMAELHSALYEEQGLTHPEKAQPQEAQPEDVSAEPEPIDDLGDLDIPQDGDVELEVDLPAMNVPSSEDAAVDMPVADSGEEFQGNYAQEDEDAYFDSLVAQEEEFQGNFEEEQSEGNFVDDDEVGSDFVDNPEEGIPQEGKQERTKAPKADASAQFIAASKALKEINDKIDTRRAELRAAKILGKDQLEDATLADLLQKRIEQKEILESFDSVVVEHFNKRIEDYGTKLGKGENAKLVLYTPWINGVAQEPVKVTLQDLFSKAKATGFTIAKRTKEDVHTSTVAFAERLVKNIYPSGKGDYSMASAAKGNPGLALIFDSEGNVNYNVVEAMHSAMNEYLLQESGALIGANRDDQKIADVMGVRKDEVTAEMMVMLMDGGITRKVAASDIGGKVLQNLGIKLESTQAHEALQTFMGFNAMQGELGNLLTEEVYMPSKEETHIRAKDGIPILKGNPDLLGAPKKLRETSNYIEDTLGVDVDRDRSYSKNPNPVEDKVLVHRAGFQEAPKEHAKLVNKLGRTAFHVNSGHEVLLEVFKKEDGTLDTDALIKHIIGPESKATNFDEKQAYLAKKNALIRSLDSYVKAVGDVKDGDMFFKWFIARNHRIHLDSTTVNPQNDKHIARWMLTARNSIKEINKDQVIAVLEGQTDGMSQEDIMTAKMFAYGIVQAFDGVDYKTIGTLYEPVVGIDKDNEAAVLKAADAIINGVADEHLVQMIHQADHVGHAALAVANLRKWKNSDESFTSDMVLEVDGLTNGFAFRTVQFPVHTEGSPIHTDQWLEKVGMLQEGSDLYDLESMNGARTMGQEDVYISVGQSFMGKIANAKAALEKGAKKGARAKATKEDRKKLVSSKWISLFEEHGKLPDFSDSSNPDTVKFIRNLMKSPVMIFNYAAGMGKIAGGLVNDQIMGKNYLSDRGVLTLLTTKEKGDYKITEAKLKELFGEEKGAVYHKARVSLHKNSLAKKGNPILKELKDDLETAIGSLYVEPLTATLEELFQRQTLINDSFTHAGQFMFDKFKEMYDIWKTSNPDASEKDKMNFLRDNAAILPGISGANSDDQNTKLTFLKNAIEQTGNTVQTNIGGKKFSNKSLSRTFGDPGVGPAVLTVLSLDSSTLARSLNEYYDGKGAQGALPVHDAIVLGIGEADLIRSYNRNFYTINRGYSIAEEFQKAVEHLEVLLKEAEPDGITAFITDIQGKPITFEQMKKTLDFNVGKIKEGRDRIFEKSTKSGQLVGPEGTMADINVAEATEDSKKFLEATADRIMSKMDNDNMRKALGDEYEQHMNALRKLLEGCKI